MNDVLTRRDAARLLRSYYDRNDRDDDFAAEVREHFGFSDPDGDVDFDDIYRKLDEALAQPPVADLEILLAGLEVRSLEELHDLVGAGRRARDKTPLVIV